MLPQWRRIALNISIAMLLSVSALSAKPAKSGKAGMPPTAAAISGNISLRSGSSLPCATKGIVLDGVVACMARDQSVQAASLSQVDRAKTESSMGELVWFESRGTGVVRVPPPSKAMKRPDPQVLSSLRDIQDRLYTHEAVKDAREEQKKREEIAEKDRVNALRNLRPGSLGVIRCLAMEDEDVAVAVCTATPD
jgi:hypothetical protein